MYVYDEFHFGDLIDVGGSRCSGPLNNLSSRVKPRSDI